MADSIRVRSFSGSFANASGCITSSPESGANAKPRGVRSRPIFCAFAWSPTAWIACSWRSESSFSISCLWVRYSSASNAAGMPERRSSTRRAMSRLNAAPRPGGSAIAIGRCGTRKLNT